MPEVTASKPAPQYQLVRQRSEPVKVERVDERPPPPTADGRGVVDGRQGLFMVLDRHELSVVPGGQTTIAIRIRNTGTLVERVTIDIPELPDAWLELDPVDIKLDVAGEAVTRLTIRPPRSAEVTAGETLFTISAWSTTNPNVRCQEGCRLTIGDFAESGFAVDPPNHQGKGRADFAVTLTNGGNQPVRGRLRARSDTATVELRPATVEVAPGATAAVVATLIPNERLITGSPTSHRVMVDLEGASNVAPVTFAYRQMPRIGRVLARVLGAVLVLALVVGVLLARTAWQDRPRAVPQVVGMSVEEATQALSDKGFKAVPREAPNDAQPTGVVFDQSPVAGKQVGKGGRVVIGVSTGPVQQSVPKLVGLTQQAATDLLTSQGLTVTIGDPADSATIPAGSVVSQNPEPNAAIAKGGAVTIVVSTGPKLVAVPSLNGLTPDTATLQLTQVHLGFVIGQFVINDQSAGRIIDQNPVAGTQVPEGTVVSVTVGSPSGA